MLILLRNREDELIERRVEVGSNIRGLRLLEVTFENGAELRRLFSEEGQKWVLSSLIPSMRH